MISVTSWADLVIFVSPYVVCPSIYLYMQTSTSVLEISIGNFAQVRFTLRSCLFVGIADITRLWHIAAIQTERSDKSACMEKFFIWRDIFTKFGIRYFLRQQCNLRRNCSERFLIAYGCHTNWSIKIKIKNFLYHFMLQKVHLYIWTSVSACVKM